MPSAVYATNRWPHIVETPQSLSIRFGQSSLGSWVTLLVILSALVRLQGSIPHLTGLTFEQSAYLNGSLFLLYLAHWLASGGGARSIHFDTRGNIRHGLARWQITRRPYISEFEIPGTNGAFSGLKLQFLGGAVSLPAWKNELAVSEVHQHMDQWFARHFAATPKGSKDDGYKRQRLGAICLGLVILSVVCADFMSQYLENTWAFPNAPIAPLTIATVSIIWALMAAAWWLRSIPAQSDELIGKPARFITQTLVFLVLAAIATWGITRVTQRAAVRYETATMNTWQAPAHVLPDRSCTLLFNATDPLNREEVRYCYNNRWDQRDFFKWANAGQIILKRRTNRYGIADDVVAMVPGTTYLPFTIITPTKH